MMSKIFNLKNLIWFCAIGLATFSGYYSVFGISKLFSGGSWSILGMAAMLELSKLVVVTFLHDHFKTLRLLFKTYLLSAAVVLMVITSIGVYGYLTNSYQETAKVVYKSQNEMILLDQKKELFTQQKSQIDKLIEEKNGRLKSLDNIRVSQQNAYTEQLTQKRGTGGLSRSMSSVDKTTESLNTELSLLTQKSFTLSDSIAKIDATKLTVSNETFSSELGPLLYLSRITGIPMDNVVNWFILILVIVFDPLAVSLVIAANHMKSNEDKKKILDELSELGQEIQPHPMVEPEPVEPQNHVSENKSVETETEEITENGTEEITEIIEEISQEIEPMDSVTIFETITETPETEEDLNTDKKDLIDDVEISILEESTKSDEEEQMQFYEEHKKQNNTKPSTIHYTRGVSV